LSAEAPSPTATCNGFRHHHDAIAARVASAVDRHAHGIDPVHDGRLETVLAP
jgi:hypothetical protein